MFHCLRVSLIPKVSVTAISSKRLSSTYKKKLFKNTSREEKIMNERKKV